VVQWIHRQNRVHPWKKETVCYQKIAPKALMKKRGSDSSASYSFLSESGSIEENNAKKKVKVPKNKSGRIVLKINKRPPIKKRNQKSKDYFDHSFLQGMVQLLNHAHHKQEKQTVQYVSCMYSPEVELVSAREGNTTLLVSSIAAAILLLW
jgi:hypothetical protein